MTAEQCDMPEHVLAVFSADPDHHVAVVGGERIVIEISNIGEQVAPLRGQHIDQVETFGLSFKNGSGG